jgi:prophage DNA circulation protein
MADSVRDDTEGSLLPCSFRGVPFYWTDGSVVGGRKGEEAAVVFSDEQIFSDVGQRQRAYSVRGFIARRLRPGTDAASEVAESYADRRRAVLAAFEAAGAGTLVHPLEGTITGLYARAWSLDESWSEIGIGRLSVEFIRDTSQATPTEDVGAFDAVAEAAEGARETALAEFASKWGISPSIVGAFDDGLTKARAAFAAMQTCADQAVTAASEINGFASAVTKATAEVAQLITAPLALSSSLSGAMSALRSAFPTAEAAFDALILGFEFGADQLLTNLGAPTAADRKRNSDAMDAVMRTLFLSHAYEAAAGIDYLTLDQIDRVDEILGDEYGRLLDLGTVDAETVDGIERLRASFSDLLEAKRLTAYRVTTADVAPTTARALAFTLYGSDELAETLAAMNGRRSYELLGGSIRILSR